MNVPSADDSLNGGLFDTSGMYFDDMGDFDNFQVSQAVVAI